MIKWKEILEVLDFVNFRGYSVDVKDNGETLVLFKMGEGVHIFYSYEDLIEFINELKR